MKQEDKRHLKFSDLKHPNTIKILICGFVPFGIALYFEYLWIEIVTSKLQMFSATSSHYDPIIVFALALGMIAPLWGCKILFNLSLQLGLRLHFIENKWPEEFDNDKSDEEKII